MTLYLLYTSAEGVSDIDVFQSEEDRGEALLDFANQLGYQEDSRSPDGIGADDWLDECVDADYYTCEKDLP